MRATALRGPIAPLFGLVALTLLVGCQKGASPPAPGNGNDTFDKRSLLTASADCALGRYRAFVTRQATLSAATSAYADDPKESNRDAARRAWRDAMASWQEAEVFRFGPAARSSQPGGMDLRDQIHGWPLVSRCAIEELVVSEGYAAPTFADAPINVRGLGAIEYLLFYEGEDNACSPASPINMGMTWSQLGAEERARRKRRYAAAAAGAALARANALVSAWEPGGGNFRDQLIRAGGGSSLFRTDQDAMNAVADGLYYVETEVKDMKLARPLGLSDCFTSTCPEALESRYAGASAANITANLTAFRRLFFGCEAETDIGFDDWLKALGAQAFSDRIAAAYATAVSSVAALDGKLEQAIAAEPAKARAAYDAMKQLTDLVKSELVTVLNLELPKTVDGDND